MRIAGLILLLALNVRAQQITTVTNDEALLAWQNSIEGNTYTNDVDSASSTVNTPLKDGSFYKAQYQTDLRRTFNDEKIDFFQFSLTHSNDPAVLSSTQNQINNLQLGRSGPEYYVSAGDVAPNFSSLSSALAVRGVLGQKVLGNYTVSLFGGKVADSWEALSNSVLRSQFLRDVYGAKVETDLSDRLGVYLTAQNSQDDGGSLTDPAAVGTLNARNVQSITIGFKYEIAPELTLAGEAAQSTSKTETQPELNGKASILDATWKKGMVTVRGGYHNLDPEYVSLSSKAQAGIIENLLSLDWKASSWLDVGAGVTKTRSTTLAAFPLVSTSHQTDAENVKAGITLSQAWGLSLQKSNSRTRDLSSDELTSNEQTSAGLKFNSSGWTAALNRSYLEVRNESLPSMEANTTNTKLSVGRQISENSNFAEAAWGLDMGFDYGLQEQDLLSGEETASVNRSLTLSGRLTKWGSLNLVLSDNTTERPNGLSDLTTLSQDIEAVHDFSQTSKGRIYYRHTESNTGAPLLAVEERVLGANFSCAF